MDDKTGDRLESGFNRAAGVAAGVGIAGAGAAAVVGAGMLSSIEAARDQAVTSFEEHVRSVSDDGAARISGAGDEVASRLEALAADLEARYASTLQGHAAALEQRISQSIEQVAHHVTEQIASLVSGGERELHRLAQQLEAELIEQRDLAVADIREAAQRAVDLASTQMDGIKSEATRAATMASAEIEDKISTLESKFSGAIETIHSTADARIAELHDFQGSFRVDAGANPEDDYKIG